VHFGLLTLDALLALRSGGLGHASGNASALTIESPGAPASAALSSRAGHTVNDIDDFGADPTGTNDSTTALNAAAAESCQ
jgi:hypothetical protein